MNDDTGNISCPMPINEFENILLAHGSGGSLTKQLIDEIFIPAFNNYQLNELGDSAILNIGDSKIAFSTDSFVVKPLFFPGGDIGKLAVYGTVNDLTAAGADPQYLSLSFILEEGFPIKDLIKITESIQFASEKAGVKVVTGDTKVVEKGNGDKAFINTTGIGLVHKNLILNKKRISAGDQILVSGNIAEHGIAIMSARQDIKFETKIESDCAPLNKMINRILKFGDKIKFMRDPTRGGLAAVLNEIVEGTEFSAAINEAAIPIDGEIDAACEIFGFDPLYIANEGKMVLIIDQDVSQQILAEIMKDEYGKNAKIIGEINNEYPGRVIQKNKIGTTRIVDVLTGEQLPRIC